MVSRRNPLASGEAIRDYREDSSTSSIIDKNLHQLEIATVRMLRPV
jgi:hypothetical protein